MKSLEWIYTDILFEHDIPDLMKWTRLIQYLKSLRVFVVMNCQYWQRFPVQIFRSQLEEWGFEEGIDFMTQNEYMELENPPRIHIILSDKTYDPSIWVIFPDGVLNDE